MIDTHAQALAYLDDHIGEGIRPGLTRTAEVLEMMGDPQKSYRVILVTGSNGKTSTTRMISQLLTAHGLRVGTFTSPHLERIEERFALDGDPAHPDDLVQAVADVSVFADLYEQRSEERLTYFELTTVVAYAFFAAHAVDVAVIEVGMGGRLDATNVADADVAVITGVSLEHTDVLGATVAEIAYEKVGIVRPGSRLIEGRLPSEARDVVVAHCEANDVQRLVFDVDLTLGEHSLAIGGWLATVEGQYATYEDVYVPLHGRHQLANLVVAIGAAEALFDRALATDAVQEGIAAVTVPGRLETVSVAPLIVIDGAHNPEGMESVADAVDDAFGAVNWIVIFGAMVDKDIEAMLPALAPVASHVVVTAVDNPRAADPHELGELVTRILDVPVETTTSVSEALSTANGIAGEGDAILVVGSLYLAGEVRSLLR